MGLEAAMVIVDNSESSRNGDYTPDRYDAQADAVSIIFSAITQANPESSVGLMSMGGRGPEVLVTSTTDHGKILEGLHRTKKKIGGISHLVTSIQIAGLALKHRQNKAQRPRIIVFTCSSIPEEERTLIKLARKMKKESISVDLIIFGEMDSIVRAKLTAFNENVKSAAGSHLVIISPQSGLLSDQLVTSSILNDSVGSGARGMDGATEGGYEDGFDFGMDPSVDPELALALRMSMDEEKARVEKQNKERAEAEAKAALPDIKEQGDTLQSPSDTEREESESKRPGTQ